VAETASLPDPSHGVGPSPHGGRAWARGTAIGAGWVVAGLLLAVAIGRLSQQVQLNSDQASSVLEGFAMGHANLLLDNWNVPSDSFFTSKLPLLSLLEWPQGLTPAVVSQAAGLLGAGVVLAAVWLAGGRLRGRTRAMAMLVTGALLTSQTVLTPGGANTFPAGVMLPAGTDHAASLLLLLVACLALLAARRSWAWLVVVWVALTAASAGDPLAAVVGSGAVVAAGALDLAVGRREGTRRDTVLILVGLSSALATPVIWWTVQRLGGFTAAPLQGVGFGFPPPVSSLGGNLALGGRSLLAVFGADIVDQPAGAAWISLLLHLVGLALVVAVLVSLLRPQRWLRLDAVSRVLALGMLVDAAAYLLVQQTDLTSARYLLPFLGFGSVLAGREGVPWLMAHRPRLSLGLVALSAAYLAVFAAGAATVQPASPPLAGVTAWLTEHGASYGLGAYWDANAVTVSSDGRIDVRAIGTSRDGVMPFLWHANLTWYDPARHRATFVLLPDADTGDRAAVKQALGAPSSETTVQGTTIMVWSKNILSAL